MSIVALGINHKTADVTLREKAYFPLDKVVLYLQDLLARNLAREAVLLSTCNRSELYCDAVDLEAVRNWFCEQANISYAELDVALYCYQDEAAINHMMQVACGLDSMIVGEPQILGQMKVAFSESCAAGMIERNFHRLFQTVFAVAKEIRTTTAIGACPVSVASTAVYFAKQKIRDFYKTQIVILGAGETSQLLMRYLQAHVQLPIIIVNRSEDNAEKIVNTLGGIYRPFNQLADVLFEADVIFSATSSPLPIINRNLLNNITKPLWLFDLAVPRDIDPAVKQLVHINLFDIDDLKILIQQHLQGREHAAIKAQELIRTKSQQCLDEIYAFDKVAHTIRAYRGQIETLCQVELLKAKQRLLQGAIPEQVLEQFARSFMNKLIHTPSVQLRQAGKEGRHDLLSLAKQLFAINDPELENQV